MAVHVPIALESIESQMSSSHHGGLVICHCKVQVPLSYGLKVANHNSQGLGQLEGVHNMNTSVVIMD